MPRKRRIDVNDIVGTTINGMKVIKYVGDKEYLKKSGYMQKVSQYLVECCECGWHTITPRTQVLQKRIGCMSCNARHASHEHLRTQEAAEKRAKASIKRRNANKNNLSGIKYYSKQLDKNLRKEKWIHKAHVGLVENGTRVDYNIYSGVNEDKAKELAIEAARILSLEGKDAFRKWYYKVKEETQCRKEEKS